MTDRFTVRTVVAGLVVLLVGTAAAMVLLTMTSHPIPDQLDRLAVGALGAVAGILAKTSSEPQEVNVVNDPEDAVPGEETPAPKRQRGQVSIPGLVVVVLVVLLVLYLAGVRF